MLCADAGTEVGAAVSGNSCPRRGCVGCAEMMPGADACLAAIWHALEGQGEEEAREPAEVHEV